LKVKKKQYYDEDAHETLETIENEESYIDLLDEVDELLMFEEILNNLEQQNPVLLQSIKESISQER